MGRNDAIFATIAYFILSDCFWFSFLKDYTYIIYITKHYFTVNISLPYASKFVIDFSQSCKQFLFYNSYPLLLCL